MHVSLPVSSNVATAIYVVAFDFVLQGLLSWLVRVFLSSENLKYIYDEGTPFPLATTRLAFISHQGLSKKGISRSVAIFSATIILLAIAGSFSIDGVSRNVAKERTVPVLVEAAPRDELVDFTAHVSDDGELATDTFHAINGALNCYDTNGDIFVRYSAISSMQTINKTRWSPASIPSNSTCITEENSFVQSNVTNTPFLNVPYDPQACKPSFQVVGEGRIAPAVVDLEGECAFETTDAWCATTPTRTCVAVVKYRDCHTMLVDYLPGPKRQLTIMRSCLEGSVHNTSLRSVVHLLDTGAVPFLFWAGFMVFLRAAVNGKVQQFDEEHETDVDLVFLAATLGIALLMLTGFAVVSYYSWFSNVHRLGRKRFNPFHTTMDMLSFTTSEVQGHEKRRYLRKGGIFVFLSHDSLQIKPDVDAEDSVPED